MINSLHKISSLTLSLIQNDTKDSGKGNTGNTKYRKCSDFFSTDHNTNHSSLTHRILDNNGSVIEVYCYLDHRLKKAWTLVMSFSYEKYNSTNINSFPLSKCRPVEESFPKLTSYRMSKSRMDYIRSHTTSWTIVCNFTRHSDITDRRDTVRGKFSQLDPLKFFAPKGECKNVSYINIEGQTCINCTSFWLQSNNAIFYTNNTLGRCEFKDKTDGKRKFGLFPETGSNFGCTMGKNSTTSLWFGD